jgi:hypothetical protein
MQTKSGIWRLFGCSRISTQLWRFIICGLNCLGMGFNREILWIQSSVFISGSFSVKRVSTARASPAPMSTLSKLKNFCTLCPRFETLYLKANWNHNTSRFQKNKYMPSIRWLLKHYSAYNSLPACQLHDWHLCIQGYKLLICSSDRKDVIILSW